jgi:UDP-N-acetyl-D-galactosamine dehydrogenase
MNRICIIGLGYVGLPLAVEFSKYYNTIGFDINQSRVSELLSGNDSTNEIEAQELKSAKKPIFTSTIDDIANANIYIVTVPTPIDSQNNPDLNPIKSASAMIAKYLKQNDIVIYESTVYPGVTEEICVPILEKSGLKFNEGFYCGYSPERINPGDKARPLPSILKITSGSTPKIAEKVDQLYKSIITAGTHLAPSIKVAEAAKVIENTQRDVNIALINELALIFNSLGINSEDVFEAAATKWNFIKLKPGLVGGHCIGVDPYYITHKAKEVGYHPDLILHARQINNGMSKFIVDKAIQLMIQNDIKIKNSRILVLGLAFKENCPDTRNSKVFDIIQLLNDFHCKVDVLDPWVAQTNKSDDFTLYSNTKDLSGPYNAVIGAVAHSDFQGIAELLDNTLADNCIKIDIKRIFEKPDWAL